MMDDVHLRRSRHVRNGSLTSNVQQGGSVMCVRRLSSDPAHLHFSLNCLPNEEEIKKLTYQHMFN